ncbi:superoxide dismutase family protein [Fodinicurvata halophila]|uniref:Superoxide dismutase [Cu-Zn] n=1 Tax=Fodinicurvata halophila TaxID=1419723 RepID=A0ABV8UKG8_9PROT
MKRSFPFLLLTGMGLLSVASATAQEPSTATATFVDANGNEIGNATATETPSGVLLDLSVDGLPKATWVAVHIHENGECDPASAHDSAGGHFNPAGRSHGYFSPGGPHAGDLPNQHVQPNGELRAEIFNHLITLDGPDDGIRSRALVIHADADDYESQPSGNAGRRLACAVIE